VDRVTSLADPAELQQYTAGNGTEGDLRMEKSHTEAVREFFDQLAAGPRLRLLRNKHYLGRIAAFHQSVILPHSRVLELGCETGQLLAAISPQAGVGIDLSPNMIDLARRSYPHLQFEVADALTYEPSERYDYVVLHNLIDYIQDIQSLLTACRRMLTHRGILVITTINPLWEPVLRAASEIGIRRPEFERRNFITNEDIRNLLTVTGYQCLFSGYRYPVPIGIPLVGPALNLVVPHLPLFRYLSSTQFIVATPLRTRHEYSVSIIIPCYNEAENIPACIFRAARIGNRTEMVVVDDGSTDGTAERAEEARNEDCEVRVIRYSPNRGKLHAICTGFQAATGEILMILDADMTVRPEDLPRFYEPLAAGYADFVNGTRAIYPMEQGAMKFANYFGNKVFSLLVSWLIDQRVSDTLCGTKAFFRDDYSFFDMGHDPWGDFDLLFGIARLRRRIVEVPIHYKERKAGVSKMRPFSHAKNLFKACWHGFRTVKLRGH